MTLTLAWAILASVFAAAIGVERWVHRREMKEEGLDSQIKEESRKIRDELGVLRFDYELSKKQAEELRVERKNTIERELKILCEMVEALQERTDAISESLAKTVSRFFEHIARHDLEIQRRDSQLKTTEREIENVIRRLEDLEERRRKQRQREDA